MWEVVYETEDYGQGYGFAKVGIKMPDSSSYTDNIAIISQ